MGSPEGSRLEPPRNRVMHLALPSRHRSTRRRPWLDALEPRCLLAAVPTADEQYMLELVNRARANPAAEGQRLVALAASDPALRIATRGWNLNTFLTTINAYPGSLPPLAFHSGLIEAARDHSQWMVDQNDQEHSRSGYLTNTAVARSDAGTAYYPVSPYEGWATGENIFAYSDLVESSRTRDHVDYLYAGFMIDWGNPGFGHLKNILAAGPGRTDPYGHPAYREIGVGLVVLSQALPPPAPGLSGVGPVVVTQEFAARTSSTPFLTGSFYRDADGDRFYSPGEGLGGVTITATPVAGGAARTVVTWASGGYSLALPAGSYNVTATGGGLTGAVTTTVTVGIDNLSWTPNLASPTPPPPPPSPAPWADEPVPGRYDDPTRSSVAVYRDATGEWFIRSWSDGSARTVGFGWAGHDEPIPADYDGDGLSNIAVYRPETAQWFIRRPDGSARVVSFGWAGHDEPIPADYDGDGLADIAVFRPETAQWFISPSAGGPLRVVGFGWAGHDRPMPADYDGDGKSDIAVFRPETAQWFISPSSGGPTQVVGFGWAGHDRPYPGDYDGDGETDLAVYRPQTGQWFVRKSATDVTDVTSFGWAGHDRPMPADYDGDGRRDIAVFRPETAEWFGRGSGGPGMALSFGAPGRSERSLDTIAAPSPAPKLESSGHLILGLDLMREGEGDQTATSTPRRNVARWARLLLLRSRQG